MIHRFLRSTLLCTAALSLHAGAGIAAETGTAAPAAGELIGLSGAVPNFDQVEIASPHVYDYTFASAPTDWRVQSGTWEMTNRWACSPGWSWFGGRSDETAAVWNKRKFRGDMSVQMYVSFKMGLSGTPAWKEFPHDVGITIGGDGTNLSSGYSLIVGADENSHSLLRKGTEVVAESGEASALLPIIANGNPDKALNTKGVHRAWWYVRIDKIGSRVNCYLDNVLMFSYNDPKPLDSGQIALWTYNNGIMLSRVQVYYQDEAHVPFSHLAKAPVNTTSPVKSAKAAPAVKGAVPVKMAMRP